MGVSLECDRCETHPKDGYSKGTAADDGWHGLYRYGMV